MQQVMAVMGIMNNLKIYSTERQDSALYHPFQMDFHNFWMCDGIFRIRQQVMTADLHEGRTRAGANQPAQPRWATYVDLLVYGAYCMADDHTLHKVWIYSVISAFHEDVFFIEE